MSESVIRTPFIMQTREEDLLIKSKLGPVQMIHQRRWGKIVIAKLLQNPEVSQAVKMFSLLDDIENRRNMETFQIEVKLMQSFKHPFLMRCLFAGECIYYLAFSMPYFQRGTLDRYAGNISPLLSERCLTQVACALRYMHKNHVAHLDIKLENIFLNADLSAILGSFRLAEEVPPPHETLLGKIGGESCSFVPEQREAQVDTQVNPYKLDSYCLGITLWALVLGRSINYYKDENINFCQETQNSKDLPSHFRNWLLKLLEKDPSSRPTVTEFVTILRQDGAFRCLIDNC